MAGRLTVSGATSQRDIDKLLELSNENQFGRNEAYYKLQHYEDLEEQGRLITLPCKIGDTVWIPNFVTYWPLRFKVNDITIKIDIENTQVGFDVDIVDIGKTVFLTKEEAEAALKGENE